MYFEKALKLAEKWHEGQTYGDHDYFEYHIKGVCRNLSDYFDEYFDHVWHETNRPNFAKIRDEIQAGAALHDILEDTNVPDAEILKFSDLTRRIVAEMTKFDDEPYFEYITYLAENGLPESRAVKMADLDFNIKESESGVPRGYKKQRVEKYKLARYILETANGVN